MQDKKHRSEVQGLVDKFFDSIKDKKEDIVDEVTGTKKPLSYKPERPLIDQQHFKNISIGLNLKMITLK